MAIQVVINQRHLQIQLKQLETVWQTVINDYNLSQAAKVLHTSQSSLSKHIAALENQLKADVFIRQGKRLVGLSPIGEQLLPHIEKIFVEIRTIENLTLDFQNPDTGELAIATTHTQARYVLPWVVKRFRERYPNVRLILSQADPESIAHMVAQGQADIGIATESLLTKDNLQCTRYYDWYHHIIVPEGHALAAQDSVDIATLAQYPLITYHGGFTGRGAIDAAFARAGLQPNIVLTALDADVISTYVALGMGVGTIAEMAYAPNARGLVKIPTQLFGKHVTWIATRADSDLRHFAKDFIVICQQQFA
ncbi:CysB family transcriptional regulator [Moraxella atlantae]|uniref:Cys regulon transcriptional activator n=1 Tax=Faucicola atlantae TaxID=34059 RepID=A0A1B8Q8P4_9GAMM|nr:LysR substrate-binding domain-containing protein [Moraxella atlantae]OBX73083.1 CysB family transcriptional regulator [Moraxella atlantae]OPH34715.1 CysB family transcriptional regulator [Moraxella atlantae]STY95323.1 Cys regulon transcriptional activator [Moraxella atlantae]